MTTCPSRLISQEGLLYLYNTTAIDYTSYHLTYRAISTRSVLLFGFINYKNYWSIDDISVTKNNGTENLITNGGFETGKLAPFELCPPSNSQPSGQVEPGFARDGVYSFIDNKNPGADILWQTFTTVPQQDYVITFLLRNFASGENSFSVQAAGLNTSNSLTY